MVGARLGVIGGSGLYEMEGLEGVETVEVETPFGSPSDRIRVGTLEGQRVAFLPRHGVGHRILPSELPSRANIYALKGLGVERIVAVSACGSLREDYAPGQVVVPDQLFDRTRARDGEHTFFGEGIVAHVSFSEPFCPDLSAQLVRVGAEIGAPIHHGGTYVCMEGPAFSTRAESEFHRRQGFDIIGMTAIPEARLAREAEICYAMLAMVTDYDVWHEEPVTQEMVTRTMQANVATVKGLLRQLVARLPLQRACPCATAVARAVVTDPARIPPESKERLRLIVGKYLS